MKDIETRTDIERLVQSFYESAIQDETIGFIFTEVAKLDLEKHIPKICDFWDSVLFSRSSYKGNVMIAHIELHKKQRLEPKHFSRWLSLWESTIMANFSGTIANEAISRAKLMAKLMQYKVDESEKRGFLG